MGANGFLNENGGRRDFCSANWGRMGFLKEKGGEEISAPIIDVDLFCPILDFWSANIVNIEKIEKKTFAPKFFKIGGRRIFYISRSLFNTERIKKNARPILWKKALAPFWRQNSTNEECYWFAIVFIMLSSGPRSAVVQRWGNLWSGWSKLRSLDRMLKIRLIYEPGNAQRTRY